MWHPVWEPLWKAVDEVDLPLHFHTFPTTAPRSRTEARQVQRAAMFTGVSAFQMGLIHIMAGMIGAGVFERHPNLRIGFGESGVGWIPYALHRMDFEFEDRFRDLMKLKPSEYWRRQCSATFQFDPIGAKLIDDIGVETIMWGSDYPHTDGIWPESHEIHRRAVRRTDRRGRSTRSPARTPPSSTACQLAGAKPVTSVPLPASGEGRAAESTHPSPAVRERGFLLPFPRAIAFAKTSPDPTGYGQPGEMILSRLLSAMATYWRVANVGSRTQFRLSRQ